MFYSARDMWVFPARISYAGDFVREMGCLLRLDCCGSRFCAGNEVFFTLGLLRQLIPRGKWGVLSARIAAVVDSARDLEHFSARIVAHGHSARVSARFSARNYQRGESAREYGVFFRLDCCPRTFRAGFGLFFRAKVATRTFCAGFSPIFRSELPTRRICAGIWLDFCREE